MLTKIERIPDRDTGDETVPENTTITNPEQTKPLRGHEMLAAFNIMRRKLAKYDGPLVAEQELKIAEAATEEGMDTEFAASLILLDHLEKCINISIIDSVDEAITKFLNDLSDGKTS